jgi:hypothetical protein
MSCLLLALFCRRGGERLPRSANLSASAALTIARRGNAYCHYMREAGQPRFGGRRKGSLNSRAETAVRSISCTVKPYSAPTTGHHSPQGPPPSGARPTVTCSSRNPIVCGDSPTRHHRSQDGTRMNVGSSRMSDYYSSIPMPFAATPLQSLLSTPCAAQTPLRTGTERRRHSRSTQTRRPP